MTTIGVIGLGTMGSGMAANFSARGWTVVGHDPFVTDANAFDFPIELLDLKTIVQSADLIVLSLPGPAQVEIVVGTLINAATRPRVIVDTSTSEPNLSIRLSGDAAAAGVHYVDSPVSGGRSGALAGELRSFVGGTDEAVAAAAGILQALTAGNAVHVGGPGAGHLVKLLNNAMVAANLAIAGEALTVADHYGIDPAVFTSAINGATGRTAVTEVNLPRWVLSGSFDSGFPVGLMARDVQLAVAAMQPTPVASGLFSAAEARWSQLLDELGPAADFNRAIEIIRGGVAPVAAQ